MSTTPTLVLAEFNIFANSFSGNTAFPRAVGLPDGRFVSTVLRDQDVFSAFYSANGSEAGSQSVGTPAPSLTDRSSIAALPGFGVVIGFVDEDGEISGRIVEGDTVIPLVTDQIGTDASVAVLADGTIVLAWASGFDYHFQLFTEAGAPVGGVHHAGAAGRTKLEIAALAGGGFVIAGVSSANNNDAVFHVFDKDGNLVEDGTSDSGTTSTNSENDTFVIGLTNGGFVTAFTREDAAPGGDGSGNGVFFVVHDADGSRVGATTSGPVLANTTTAGNQKSPAGCALSDGGFVLVWKDGNDGTDNIVAQVFDSDGARRGSEFTVADTDTVLSDPSVAELADGRILFTWDNPTLGARGNVFDPRTAGVVRNGTTGDDIYIGSDFADTLRGQAGRDVLIGGLDADILEGGEGDDRYLIDEFDTVIEAAGSAGGTDLIHSTAAVDLRSAAHGGGNVENALLEGSLDLAVTGSRSANVLAGNEGENRVTGGRGKDVLFGADGADTFDFNAVNETGKTAKTRDAIGDFEVAVDTIDLSTIDANGSASGHKFKFLAGNGDAFTGKAGQLRWFKENNQGQDNDRTIVEGDIDGDKRADFQIELTKLKNLTAGDFEL